MAQRLGEHVVSSLRAFERAWLDPLVEPIGLAIESSGWAPDDPEAYCDRCGATVGPAEALEFGCSRCQNTRPAWGRFVRLGEYDPPLSDWIQQLKFERRRRVAAVLGKALGESARRSGALAGIDPKAVGIVPVPMPGLRFLARGINHTRAIALEMGKELDIRVVDVLRAKHHRSQRMVPSSSRRDNVRGKYRVVARRTASLKRIIVVDDVVTTRATATEVCRSIRKVSKELDLWMASVAVVA